MQSDTLAAAVTAEAQPDLEAIFIAHYPRICRVLARVVHDHARAEELAVDVFLKWSTRTRAHGDGAPGWLYRTAVRTGLDDLRRHARRSRYETLLTRLRRGPATPEDVHAASESQRRVRAVLAALRRRDAELLLLRAQDLSYEEVAAALRLNAASVGTLLSRAQAAFRREYTKRYGTD